MANSVAFNAVEADIKAVDWRNNRRRNESIADGNTMFKLRFLKEDGNIVSGKQLAESQGMKDRRKSYEAKSEKTRMSDCSSVSVSSIRPTRFKVDEILSRKFESHNSKSTPALETQETSEIMTTHGRSLSNQLLNVITIDDDEQRVSL